MKKIIATLSVSLLGAMLVGCGANNNDQAMRGYGTDDTSIIGYSSPEEVNQRKGFGEPKQMVEPNYNQPPALQETGDATNYRDYIDSLYNRGTTSYGNDRYFRLSQAISDRVLKIPEVINAQTVVTDETVIIGLEIEQMAKRDVTDIARRMAIPLAEGREVTIVTTDSNYDRTIQPNDTKNRQKVTR